MGMLKLDARAKVKFVEIYMATGRLAHTAGLLGFSSSTLRDHRKSDTEFDENVKEAYALFRDMLEAEAKRRAVDGWDEPVFYKGEICGSVKKHSDRILELMLKRHIPDYREKVAIDANVTYGVLVVPPVSESNEAWQAQYGNKGEIGDANDKTG